MTVRWVGFGMRWMTLPLHTGQSVGSRGVLEASPMYRSVGDAEAVRKFKRQNAIVQIAPHLTNENGVGPDRRHVPLGFDTAFQGIPDSAPGSFARNSGRVAELSCQTRASQVCSFPSLLRFRRSPHRRERSQGSSRDRCAGESDSRKSRASKASPGATTPVALARPATRRCVASTASGAVIA